MIYLIYNTLIYIAFLQVAIATSWYLPCDDSWHSQFVIKSPNFNYLAKYNTCTWSMIPWFILFSCRLRSLPRDIFHAMIIDRVNLSSNDLRSTLFSHLIYIPWKYQSMIYLIYNTLIYIVFLQVALATSWYLPCDDSWHGQFVL